MATSSEFEDLYWQVRDRLFGRHFAFGVAGRANLMSLDNSLTQHAFFPPGEPVPTETTRRWDVSGWGRDNPLMWSGRLLASVAVDRALGHPQAERTALAALDSIGLLFRRRWGPEFDGYIARWDAATAERRLEVNGSRLAQGFLVDPESGQYLDCVPHSDPRHVPYRANETLQTLMTPDQEAEYQAHVTEHYDQGYRRWEVSMDELCGLMAAYSILHTLIPTPAVRSRVATQSGLLADYLAAHSYLLVRPLGGLTCRGATGGLPGLEWPFDRVFQRVTGRSWPRRRDFVGAMERAGYWRLLQLPVDRVAAGVIAGGALGSPLLLGWLASGTPMSLLVGAALGALPVTGGVATPALVEALPALLAAAPRSLGLYAHRDTFDMEEPEGPAFAHLLLALPPGLRFRVLIDVLAVLPESAVQNFRGFLPFIGLTAIDDSDPLVRTEYLRLMQIRRAGQRVDDRWDLLYGAFASAVAVLNGMGESEEEHLVDMLQQRYEQIRATPEYLPLGEDNPDLERVDKWPLDYLVALSLAWLHARRRADAGEPVRTAGFPAPPGPRPSWPGVAVPPAALAVWWIRKTLGVPPTPRGADDTPVQLFDGIQPTDRPASVPPILQPTSDHVLIDRVTVRVRDTAGDVPTGVTIQPGDEFEISATGAITAPEFLAQPSDANGWYVVDDASFALHSGLDPVNAHKYALLGRLGGYFFCGTHRPRQRFLYHRPVPLYLRVNNDGAARGAGNGEFTVRVDIFGSPRLQAEFRYAEIPSITGVGVISEVRVAFRNRGSAWDPSSNIRLVLDPARSDPVWPAREIMLTTHVEPREVAAFDTAIPAPAQQGTYRLAWSLMAGDVPLAASDQRTVTVIDSRCFELTTLIADLPAAITAAQADVAAATGSAKGRLTRRLNELRKQLRDAQAEFQARGCT
jgi:hypothetical protein